MKVILPKYKKRKINPFLATYFGPEGQGNKKVLEVNCSTTIKPMMGILMQNDFLQKSSVKKEKKKLGRANCAKNYGTVTKNRGKMANRWFSL